MMEILYRDLTPEDKEKLKQAIKNSLLSTKLKEVIQSLLRQAEPKPADYEIASWSYYQADYLGYSRALKTVLKLLDHEKEN
jgi:hypothetical protein